MLLLSLLLACTGKDTGDEAAPTITFLQPTESDSLAIGPFSAVVVVDYFTLEDPAKHNEGEAEGYITVTLDGTEVLITGETQFVVTTDTMGTYTLGAELLYADGDPLEPRARDEVVIQVE